MGSVAVGYSDVEYDPPLFSARGLRLAGELALTAGLIVLLFAAYEFFGVSWAADRAQRGLENDLDRRWAAGAPLVPGQAAERLYIPRLRRHWVVVQGVTDEDLAKGPGHYISTDAPGALGNTAIAGHRLRHLFWDLDQVRPGDPIGIQTATGWFVYRVLASFTVKPNNTTVIAHNPEHPGSPPTRRLLTLTTCDPKFQNYRRLIVMAELQSVSGRAAGMPAALRG